MYIYGDAHSQYDIIFADMITTGFIYANRELKKRRKVLIQTGLTLSVLGLGLIQHSPGESVRLATRLVIY